MVRSTPDETVKDNLVYFRSLDIDDDDFQVVPDALVDFVEAFQNFWRGLMFPNQGEEDGTDEEEGSDDELSDIDAEVVPPPALQLLQTTYIDAEPRIRRKTHRVYHSITAVISHRIDQSRENKLRDMNKFYADFNPKGNHILRIEMFENSTITLAWIQFTSNKERLKAALRKRKIQTHPDYVLEFFSEDINQTAFFTISTVNGIPLICRDGCKTEICNSIVEYASNLSVAQSFPIAFNSENGRGNIRGLITAPNKESLEGVLQKIQTQQMMKGRIMEFFLLSAGHNNDG